MYNYSVAHEQISKANELYTKKIKHL
jgi:hypothetical protein